MGFFGKSDEEWKQIAADLSRRKIHLDNREIEIKRKATKLSNEQDLIAADKVKCEAERANHNSEYKRTAVTVYIANAHLETRRS